MHVLVSGTDAKVGPDAVATMSFSSMITAGTLDVPVSGDFVVFSELTVLKGMTADAFGPVKYDSFCYAKVYRIYIP